MDNLYLVIGHHAWGTGKTVAEATKVAKRNVPWGLLRKDAKQIEMKCWLIHPDTEVDGMGGLRYPRQHPPVEQENVTIKVPRR